MDGIVDYLVGGVVEDPYVLVHVFYRANIRVGVVEDVLLVGFLLILLG
jgi:hypothetical protein